jgi:uncharacterized membrane protein YqjE
MKTAVKWVIMLTIYLIIYIIIWSLNLSIILLSVLFLFSPFFLLWTIYQVLKEENFEYPEMEEKDEWGYLDKPNHKSLK